MSCEFPQYSNSAKLGEQGVSIVAKIISDSFGWLFKRNHQEHDFGIDGQIELVTEDGFVTGQMLAAQIKCGISFLKEKNQWGYVYRGERKHFNYLTNYPTPVIIIICEPNTSECYWVRFDPEQTESTGTGWKITVPFENNLSTSKEKITSFLRPVRDSYAELEHYWEINKVISESGIILYVLDEKDIEEKEIILPRAFFDRLRATRELAAQCQGKVEILFSGYNDDPREVWEIPEIRDYIAVLEIALDDLLFFARVEQPTYTLLTFALCQTKVDFMPALDQPGAKSKHFTYDPLPVAEFITRHCPALNKLTEWLNMPREEEKRLFYDVVKCLGLHDLKNTLTVPN